MCSRVSSSGFLIPNSPSPPQPPLFILYSIWYFLRLYVSSANPIIWSLKTRNPSLPTPGSVPESYQPPPLRLPPSSLFVPLDLLLEAAFSRGSVEHAALHNPPGVGVAFPPTEGHAPESQGPLLLPRCPAHLQAPGSLSPGCLTPYHSPTFCGTSCLSWHLLPQEAGPPGSPPPPLTGGSCCTTELQTSSYLPGGATAYFTLIPLSEHFFFLHFAKIFENPAPITLAGPRVRLVGGKIHSQGCFSFNDFRTAFTKFVFSESELKGIQETSVQIRN